MRTVALLLLMGVALTTLPADLARATPMEPPLVAREEVDIPITLAMGGLWLVTELGLKDQFSAPAFDGSRYEHIGDMDRSVIGNWAPSLDKASDVLLVTCFVTPFLFNNIDHAIWGKDRAQLGRWIWSDVLIILEAVAFAGAITNVAKWAFARHRPFNYIGMHDTAQYDTIQQDEELRSSLQEAMESQNAALSFWSGHTTLAFTALCASATLLTSKHLDGHPAPLFALWGGTIAAGIAVAALRVESGMHFPSDVIVGALMGSAIGIVVPALHRNRALAPVAVAPLALREGGGLAFTAVW
jgi:membrane-associated phospholipid phosphatase